MNFEQPPPRRTAEPFVPMINVVFLLLIFFLMTAQITPQEPFGVTPPASSERSAPDAETRLYLSEEGLFGFADLRGDAAIAEAVRVALAGAPDAPASLALRVDGNTPARLLAEATERLSAAGIQRLEIVTRQR